MANIQKVQTSSELASNAKRKRVLAAVAQEIVTSEDDDNIADICDIMESHNDQHQQSTSSSQAIYALGETIRNTLLEINEIRELNRERRHKELLEILTKMVNHDTGTSKSDVTFKGNILETCLIPNQIKVKPQEVKEEQNLAEQYTIIDELTTEPVVDEESCSSNSSRTLTSINTHSSADDNDAKLYNLSEAPLVSIIKPINSKSITGVVKKQSQSDLEKMRAQMLEMQRKKMDDRVRKKRDFLQMQN